MWSYLSSVALSWVKKSLYPTRDVHQRPLRADERQQKVVGGNAERYRRSRPNSGRSRYEIASAEAVIR
jgi:hypothetical protein